ncbi:MAG: hypothetical protein KDA51_06900, partial [Planctomycetales bacterium]|nr:hypothetical protein [Planctomycetales bacterium]
FSPELLNETSTPPHLMVRHLALTAELPLEQRRDAARLIREKLPFAEPQANLVAVQLLGSVASAGDIQQLATWVGLTSSSPHDPAVSHVARIAIRDILRDETQLALATKHWADWAKQPTTGDTPAADRVTVDRIVAETLLAVPSSLAASRLLDYVAAHPNSDGKFINAALAAATKHADADLLERLLVTLKKVKPNSLLDQAQQFERVCDVYLGGHTELSPPLRSFGVELQSELATQLRSTTPCLTWSDARGNDWATESRESSAGEAVRLRSSFTRGEKYTGELSSEPFACPDRLQFLLAGHNGLPGKADQHKNYIALQSVPTGEQLRQAFPPRNDTAQPVQWSLSDVAGQMVRLVLNDGDDGASFAWLAAGQFSLDTLNPSNTASKLDAYMALVKRGLQPVDIASIESLPLSPQQRGELIIAALTGSGQATEATLAAQALKLGRVDLVTSKLISKDPPLDLLEWSKPLAASATLNQQREMAGELLRTAEGCRLLRKLLENGVLSPLSMRLNEALLPAAISADTKQYLQDQIEQA